MAEVFSGAADISNKIEYRAPDDAVGLFDVLVLADMGEHVARGFRDRRLLPQPGLRSLVADVEVNPKEPFARLVQLEMRVRRDRGPLSIGAESKDPSEAEVFVGADLRPLSFRHERS